MPFLYIKRNAKSISFLAGIVILSSLLLIYMAHATSHNLLHLRTTTHPTTTTTTTTTTTNTTTPPASPRTPTATKRWKTQTELKYDVVSATINALDAVGIDAFLYGGSALGAYRNHGWFSWDKDADLLVLSSNHGLIQSVLDALPSISSQSTHTKLNSGHKYGVTDFGYHIALPASAMNDSHPYIDLWLAEHLPSNQIRLVSGDAWCDAVGQRSRASCKPMPKEWFYPPLIVPYGPYLMPTPRSKYVETSKIFFLYILQFLSVLHSTVVLT